MRWKVITFRPNNFITFCVDVITFCVSQYYILRRLLLHFAPIIAFCGVTCATKLLLPSLAPSYQTGVITAEKLRLSNSTAGKYLLKQVLMVLSGSVSLVINRLKKDKMPPCAAKNGMSFPANQTFFLFE